MAVTWNAEVTLLNAAEKSVRVVWTRIDDADPDHPFNYPVKGNYDTTLGETLGQIRDRLAAQAFAAWGAEADQRASVAALKAQWEGALSEAVQALEDEI